MSPKHHIPAAQREMQKGLSSSDLNAADMATGVDIHSSGDDADSGSEISSIYTSYSSDSDSMDFEEGYDAAGTKTFALATGDSEVGINMILLY